MTQVLFSLQAKLLPAPSVGLKIHCQGHPFVAASLVDAQGKPIEQVLPRDGTGKHAPKKLPTATPGAQVHVKLAELQQGFLLPLDLPGARAKKLDTFELTFVVKEEPIHKCC